MISKMVLKNFCKFESKTISFQRGLNVLVGNNGSGKSTVIEAINLCLTKRWNGGYFEQELSHHFITSTVADDYIDHIRAGENPIPPEIVIELYFDDDPALAMFKGTNNSLKEDAPGYRLRAGLDPDFNEEYQEFLSEPRQVATVPTEFYRIDWTTFAGQTVNPRLPKVRSSIIDASRIRLQSGADYHLQKIIRDTLDTKQRALLARSFRTHQEEFATNKSVKIINAAIVQSGEPITDKAFTLEIDTSGPNGWESALSPHLDRLPFSFSGSGEQQKLKILLALERKVDDYHVILIEEPENHLAFSNLNELVERIVDQSHGRQIIVATHSSFVVNKLGLDQLILLGDEAGTKLTQLPDATQDYFKKLPGYDTLRVVLAKKVALVEGPSDELVFQRAYFDRTGKRPIEDGVDVISVRGLSAKRFLDLAIPLHRRTVVLTDNDGDHEKKVDQRYASYTQYDFISVRTGQDDSYPTLEPQLFASNGLDRMNSLLGEEFQTEEKLLSYMANHKTDVAIALFDTNEDVTWPPYIEEAIDDLLK
ncbi:ATP-dependent nuclease [Bifidobacterium mongoliense]|uniref:ATP-dependent endonuclease n=1 Tax=Bifidobacterium mongoliense TaxID=518643 RepID=A0A423UBX0_9BIFI|nr:AAA family ATPase [Bifidobacterium mongoliense]ROT86190.1 ATP-dependent endonuclease [Bifidobacterium mongoliense]